MKRGLSKKPGKGGRAGFILFPAVFFLLGSLIVLGVTSPFLQTFGNVLDIAFLQESPDFDKEAANIYRHDASRPDGNEVIHVDSADMPAEGEQFGKIVIGSAQIDAPLFYGDGAKELRRGVGCYTGTYLPGAGRTVLLAGHNHTFFKTLGQAKEGDQVQISTSYGEYVYEITGTRVAYATDTTAYDLTREEENLILYTCYPFGSVGLTPERLFVYAKYVSGPRLDWDYD